MEEELRIALDQVTARTGWDDCSRLVVTLRYLDQLMTTCGQNAADFHDFLMQQAEEEEASSGEQP